MNDVRLSSTILSLILSTIMSGIFLYLWATTRRRHLGFWTAALAANASILVCTALRVTRPDLDAWLRLAIDFLGGAASILIFTGTMVFAQVQESRYRRYLLIPVATMAWSVIANRSGFDPMITSVPVFAFVGISIMSVGVLFFSLPHLSRLGASRYAGVCLFIWGLLNGTYPLSLRYHNVSPLGHYGAAAMSLMSGMFLLVVSVEEQREQTESDRERLKVTLSSIGDAVIAVDASARVTLLNPTAEILTGWTEKEAEGRPITEVFRVINEETLEPATDIVAKVLSTGETIGLANHTALLSRDGIERSIADSAAPIHGPDGSIEGVILVFRDVTNERRQQRALRDSEARFRLIAEHTSDIIFRLKLKPELKFDYLSPGVIQVLGHTPEEVYADSSLLAKALLPEDHALGEAVLSGTYGFEKPFTLRWRRGRDTVWTEQRAAGVYDADGNLVAIDGIARDVTEQKIVEQRLKYVSLHDPLTGLYNRAYFEEELRRLERSSTDRPVSIISADVNGLKLINDTMGHKKGDDLLRAFAGVLTGAFLSNGIVARVGGDEFAVILRRTGEEDASRALGRLDNAIALYNQTGPETPLSVSMGSATAGGTESSLEETFARADKAMYTDKLRAGTSAKSGIVKGLLAALAAKDFVAEGHVSRVTQVACELGQASGLTKKEMSDLALLSEVHDLGKVGIPDRILFKPGPLTPEEREEMKQHSSIGFRIAKASVDLAHVANLILHHHEWWDGSGYPAGLKGEEIPLECRILAIADAYDAMRSDRPYKKARSHDWAVAELRRCAGTQFDPELVERFIAAMGDGAAASGDAAAALLRYAP
ncbi:MAG: HD domain-containing phosphohydrolase [Bacillota bacterium]